MAQSRRYKRRFSQPPIKGGRDPLPSCVLHEISQRVEAIAREFGVSKSWVIATHLARAFGVTEQIDYRKMRREGEIK